MKRKRSIDTEEDANEDKLPVKRVKNKKHTEKDDSNNSGKHTHYLPIIIDDDEIEMILGRGTYYGKEMFRFERLNGNGQAVIPVDLARTNYPNAVISFYEKCIVFR